MKFLGKHYAISDIHGMYGSYVEAIKRLNCNDTLYILGDVIDRGHGGFDIIQDIMKRQEKNPKIILLLGNHEILFLLSIMIIEKYNLSKEDILNIIQKICTCNATKRHKPDRKYEKR